jgi:endonuclease/exonuclease/phosphatase family metal-dependent hydrolase
MTYNIHRWAGADQRLDIERLAGVIRAAGADVVALNEVLHPVTTGLKVHKPLDELADCLGMTYAFGPSGWIDYAPGWQGAVGNALLSRYPLTDVTNRWLPSRTASKQRSLLAAALSTGQGCGLVMYVTHLDHAWEGTRLCQIKGALQMISQAGAPHFLAGDFNTPGFLGPRSRRLLPPVLRRLRKAGYEDAFMAVGTGNGRTFPASAPLVRFDFLFLPVCWAGGLRSASIVDHSTISHASDHRPVVIEWGWPVG